ncbi:MAG: TIGR03960 family B12-binding radical SAM protein [Spirochaetota bacterium]
MKGSIFNRIEPFLPYVSKPARYIGNEINVVRKDPSKVQMRMAICYPDLYDVGMCNLGVKIIYHLVNTRKEFYCERVFSPWPDFEKVLREHRIPLYSLETFTPLSAFDIVGFSVGYELLYTNILAVLELGGVPLWSTERDEAHPLVIAGGASVYNPEPVADFVDVFVLGDGETAVMELMDRLLMVKNEPRTKKLHELDKFDFTYVPSFYPACRQGVYVVPKVAKHIKRRIEPDLEVLPYPVKQLVPLTGVVQERLAFEISRGCTTGCRYCQAGYTYRPVRERSVQNILELIKHSLRYTGYDEVSLLSLSVGDYSQLMQLVYLINSFFSEQHISVALPSLRVNSANQDVLRMTGAVRKSGLTFAIESADPLIRRRINKSVDTHQLHTLIDSALKAGWRLIKLYFMIGLPMAENEQADIAGLINELKKNFSGLSINVNVGVFIPKPHTPFEREKQLELEKAQKIIGDLRKTFRRSRIKIKFQDPGMSMIEGVLSRGDRSVSGLLSRVFQQGERFSSWDEFFNLELWKDAMEEAGLSPELYLEAKNRQVPLPWEFIDCGISKKFLSREKKKAEEGEVTPDCVYDICPGCGVCTGKIKNQVSGPVQEKQPPQIGPFGAGVQKGKKQECRVLFQFSKMGIYRFISHLDLVNLLTRIGRKQGVNYKHTSGFNPRPYLKVPFALPLGLRSEYEIGEVVAQQPIGTDAFMELFNRQLDRELKIKSARIVPGKKSVASCEYFHDYRIVVDSENTGIRRAVLDMLRVFEAQGVIEGKKIFDNSKANIYTIYGSQIYIRLDGKRSIKSIFKINSDSEKKPGYLDVDITRIMLWMADEQVLVPFI